jgi:hypothetical protein
MIFNSSADALGDITYHPFEHGVQSGFMPYDILPNQLGGNAHPYADFFGAGVTENDIEAWSQTGASQWNFKGHMTGADEGFHIWWNATVDTDPVVNVSLLMTNNTPFDQTFTLTVPLVTGAFGPTTKMNGSLSGSATDVSGNGGLLETDGSAGYIATIDNNVVKTMVPDGSQFSISNNATANIGPFMFGFPIEENGPGVVNEIGLTLTFTLSAFDSAMVQGVFEVTPIPAPGAAVLLAFAGLVGVRRRRA